MFTVLWWSAHTIKKHWLWSYVHLLPVSLFNSLNDKWCMNPTLLLILLLHHFMDGLCVLVMKQVMGGDFYAHRKKTINFFSRLAYTYASVKMIYKLFNLSHIDSMAMYVLYTFHFQSCFFFRRKKKPTGINQKT